MHDIFVAIADSFLLIHHYDISVFTLLVFFEVVTGRKLKWLMD